MAASVRHLDSDGATAITGVVWPDAFAGQAQTARKFGVENNGDRTLTNVAGKLRQVGSNDGVTMARWARDTATLSAPWGVGATLTGSGAGGVWPSVGVRYYRLTATNATGETVGSSEVSANVDDTTKKVQLSWTAVPGATGYRIYRTETQGQYSSPALRAELTSGSITSYTDDGGAVGAGALPAANTTGGPPPSYGTPPTLGTSDLAFGTLAVGQQAFYWVNWEIPAATPEVGNPRLFEVEFVES